MNYELKWEGLPFRGWGIEKGACDKAANNMWPNSDKNQKKCFLIPVLFLSGCLSFVAKIPTKPVRKSVAPKIRQFPVVKDPLLTPH